MPMKPPAKDGNAGQIVTSPSAAVTSPVKEQFHRPSYLPTRNPENMPKTLADVVKQMEESEQRLLKKKMTFEEWFKIELDKQSNYMWYELNGQSDYFKKCWNAAQENV